MAITLTPNAQNHINKFLAKRGKGIGIRLGTKTSGCSGLAYVLEFVDTVLENDVVFNIDNLAIVVANDNLKYLDGTEIDYVKDGLQEGFQFNNPNVKATCGCKESFTV